MDNIVIGKYLPLNSFIHRLDPRCKIIAILLFIIAIFIPSGWYGYLFLSIITLIIVKLAKIKYTYVLKLMKPMIFMMIFLLLINVITIRQGTVLCKIFTFPIYLGAITQTLYIVVRLALMIAITCLLTATTKPLDLTVALEDLLTPLTKIGFPSHIMAMMISIALRFIPTLIEETNRIMKAQASRGVDFSEGKLMEKIKAMISLIIPLFLSAFSKATDLADAMEARGYSPDGERTRYRQLQFTFKDAIALCFSLISLLIVIGISLL